jgi:tetratricopeptide (TPR) repeat protein
MDKNPGHRLYDEGRAAFATGERDRAIQLLTESADLSPHFKTLEVLGAALLEKGDFHAAVMRLAAAAGLGPRQSKPRFLLAQALLRLGVEYRDDAARHLVDCLKLNPDYANARTLLDSILMEDPSVASRLRDAGDIK